MSCLQFCFDAFADFGAVLLNGLWGWLDMANRVTSRQNTLLFDNTLTFPTINAFLCAVSVSV